MIKKPKEVKKAVQSLNKLVSYLEYYMGGTREFKTIVKQDLDSLCKTLIDLAEDEEKHDIELRKAWEKENEHKN